MDISTILKSLIALIVALTAGTAQATPSDAPDPATVPITSVHAPASPNGITPSVTTTDKPSTAQPVVSPSVTNVTGTSAADAPTSSGGLTPSVANSPISGVGSPISGVGTTCPPGSSIPSAGAPPSTPSRVDAPATARPRTSRGGDASLTPQRASSGVNTPGVMASPPMSPAAYSTDGRSVTEAAQAPREYSSSRDTYASGAGSRGGYDPNATGTAQTENCVQPGVSSLPVRNVADAQPDSLAPAARAPQRPGGRGGRGSGGRGGRGSGGRGSQDGAGDTQGPQGGPSGVVGPQVAPAALATAGSGARGARKVTADCAKETCVTAGGPLNIGKGQGGTEGAPRYYSGNGTPVGAISIRADHVVVRGFTVSHPNDTGITIEGNDVTVQDNTVDGPDGHDGDTLRFFGNNINILHNTLKNTNNMGGKRHADCMQTFVTSTNPSHTVHIDSNICQNISNICLMAEGAGSKSGGQGKPPSYDWWFTNNYCQFGASQGLQLESISNVFVTGNTFSGRSDKAVSCVQATATVSGNSVPGGMSQQKNCPPPGRGSGSASQAA